MDFKEEVNKIVSELQDSRKKLIRAGISDGVDMINGFIRGMLRALELYNEEKENSGIDQ